jgi:trehalose synthase
VYRDVLQAWYAMPASARARTQLVMIPTGDVDENAAIVNALQRHAAIIVQKSLHEGFGLTVTEAMWKGRAVLAPRVGGIQDQIVDGESGVLIDDPRDLSAFCDALGALIADPARCRRLGEGARLRVRDHFLGVRHLLDYVGIITRLIS